MKTNIPKSKDPLLQQVPNALLRASEKARLLAEQTGTPFIVRQPPETPVSDNGK